MMTSFQIDAIDTLFFRDGKPFSMGEETWANGLFPPYPSTVYGMLRSLHFATHLNELSSANTIVDPTLALALKGYILGLSKDTGEFNTAFPIPNDLYAEGREKPNQATLFRCVARPSEEKIISDYPFDYVLETQGQKKIQTLGGKALLTGSEFTNYLSDAQDQYDIEWLSHYMTEEPKVGIGRDYHTRSSAEGKLYRVAMNRPAGEKGSLQLLLKFEGLRLADFGISRFGAEGKAIEYQLTDFPEVSTSVTTQDKYFKIYFATPAIFKEGAYPLSWLLNHGLKLLTGASGKPEYIGGFDLKKVAPKPMLKAIPAGTVFYVKIEDEKKAAGIIEKLHEGSIYNLAPKCDVYQESFQKQGFGLTYIGKLNIKNNA